MLVDQRPRFAEFTDDGKLLYVSSEIGGTVSVIDPATQEIVHTIAFEVPGVPPEALQPVGVRVTSDGSKVYVALGPSNRVAVIDGASWEVLDYLLVGQRVWQLAFTPDEELPLHHQRHLQRRLGDRRGERHGAEVDPGGAAALGRGGLAGVTARRRDDHAGLGDRGGRGRRWLGGGAEPHHPPAGGLHRPVTPVLAVRDVSHAFGKLKALEGVSLTVAEGEFVALLGVNGAGKTTLFSLITRLYDNVTGRDRGLRA